MSRSSRPRGARLLVLTAAAVAATGAGLCAAPLATAAPTAAPATTTATGGGFVPVTPSRILDTRIGVGAPKAKVGPGASLAISMASRAGLPAAGGATAVVLNLTSVGSTTGSYLTAYPAGGSVPDASSLNFAGGVTTANLVTVPLSSDGRIAVFNKAGSTDVVADVIGYYSSTENAAYGGLTPFSPTRYYDSRDDNVSFINGTYVDIFDDFASGSVDPNADITGWVANVTAVSPTSDGYVTAWDGSGAKPITSSLNFRKGVTVANLVEVKRGNHTVQGKSLPSFRLQTTLPGRTGLIVDVVGVYTEAGSNGSADARFHALATPLRIVDTRSAQSPNLAPGATRELSAAAVGSPSTIALAANLTVAGPTAPTYVTVYSGDRPDVSSISANKGAVLANASIFEVSQGSTSAGSFDAYNSAGTTPFLVDVAGTFDLPAATSLAPASSSWRATNPGAARG